jgi:hypothetical protein
VRERGRYWNVKECVSVCEEVGEGGGGGLLHLVEGARLGRIQARQELVQLSQHTRI